MKFELELTTEGDGRMDGYVALETAAGKQRMNFADVTPENVLNALGILGDTVKDNLTPEELGIIEALNSVR